MQGAATNSDEVAAVVWAGINVVNVALAAEGLDEGELLGLDDAELLGLELGVPILCSCNHKVIRFFTDTITGKS